MARAGVAAQLAEQAHDVAFEIDLLNRADSGNINRCPSGSLRNRRRRQQHRGAANPAAGNRRHGKAQIGRERRRGGNLAVNI